MLGLPQGHNIIIIILLCDVTRPQLKRLNLHLNQTVNTNIISLRRRNTIYLQFNFIFVLQTYFEWFCAKYRYQMETERLVQNMRALLCVNSSLGIFPSGGSPRDNSGNLITVDQVQFPGVDCSEVFSDIFIGNE